MPAVTTWFAPLATSYRTMRDVPESGSELPYASQRESREKLGVVWIRSPVHRSFATRRGHPPSTGSRKSEPVLSQKTRFFESGEKSIRRRKTLPPLVSAFGSPLPSAGASTTSYSPLASESQATHFASGLHVPSRSATPLVCVRLRG